MAGHADRPLLQAPRPPGSSEMQNVHLILVPLCLIDIHPRTAEIGQYQSVIVSRHLPADIGDCAAPEIRLPQFYCDGVEFWWLKEADQNPVCDLSGACERSLRRQ